MEGTPAAPALEDGELNELEPNSYRNLAGLRFEQLCRLTGLTNTRLAQMLGDSLNRPKLTRQTLAGWRSGRQPVPMEAFFALLEIAGRAGMAYLLAATEEDFARFSSVRRKLPRKRAALATSRMRRYFSGRMRD